MDYKNLISKNDKLSISNLVLGTDYFGTTVDKATSFSLLDLFSYEGGNCIDTARMYADWLPNGHSASERLIGEWLKSK